MMVENWVITGLMIPLFVYTWKKIDKVKKEVDTMRINDLAHIELQLEGIRGSIFKILMRGENASHKNR